MIKAKRIGHATFATPDLDRQIDYFQQVVGLCLAEREANRAFLATNSGQLAVVLEKASQPGCTRLAFEESPELSVGEMTQRLSALGLKGEARSDFAPRRLHGAYLHRLEGHDDRVVLGVELRAQRPAGRRRISIDSGMWHSPFPTRRRPPISTNASSGSGYPIGSATTSSSFAAMSTITPSISSAADSPIHRIRDARRRPSAQFVRRARAAQNRDHLGTGSPEPATTSRSTTVTRTSRWSSSSPSSTRC